MTKKRKTGDRVAARLACVYCIFVRGWAEVKHRHPHQMRLETSMTAQELSDAARRFAEEWSSGDARVAEELSAFERKQLQRKLGTWTVGQLSRATWLADGIQPLAWSLGKLDARIHSSFAYQKRFLPERLEKTGGAALLRVPNPRPAEEVRSLLHDTEFLLWRFHVENLLTGGWLTPAGEGVVRAHLDRRLAKEARSSSVPFMGGDVLVGRKRFAALDPGKAYLLEQYGLPLRRHALRWVLGLADWDAEDPELELGIPLKKEHTDHAGTHPTFTFWSSVEHLT